MRLLRIVALGLLAFMATANGNESSQGGVGDAMPTILRANREWVTAMQQGDVDKIVQPYASDAVFVMATGESIRGREAIRSMYRERLTKAKIVAASIHHQGSANGDHGLVYEWGTGTVSARALNGAVTTGGGPYLTVWKQDPDGTWKIIRNIVL